MCIVTTPRKREREGESKADQEGDAPPRRIMIINTIIINHLVFPYAKLCISFPSDRRATVFLRLG